MRPDSPFRPHHTFSPLWWRILWTQVSSSCISDRGQTFWGLICQNMTGFLLSALNLSSLTGLTLSAFSWVCSCCIWSSKQRSSTGNEPTYLTERHKFRENKTWKHSNTDTAFVPSLPLLFEWLCHLLWLVPHPCCRVPETTKTKKQTLKGNRKSKTHAVRQ